MIPLTVCTAAFAAAALILTLLGALRSSARLGFFGGLCFAPAAAGALILGLNEKALLLMCLVLLCAARAGGKAGRRRSADEL